MPVVVAIPARNECDYIWACLRALDQQHGARIDDIVLLVNDTTDGTAERARATALHNATRLHVLERVLAPDHATAGHARRLAMAEAAILAGPRGVLLTTDADSTVDPGWLAANLAALDAGADVVAGWVDLDAADAARIPPSLQADDDRECAYDALCDEIHARLDPDAADPMPRHTQNSGASIAVTAEAYARSGGVPPLPCGEDRAFIAALRRIDAQIRHSPQVHVTVSGRVEGRSPGGMADTIRRRVLRPDEFIDDRLEPATDCVRRARCRAEARWAYRVTGPVPATLAERLGLDVGAVADALAAPYFGIAWETIEATAPALRRVRVRRGDVAVQMEVAHAIVVSLRDATDEAGLTRRGDRSDSRVLEPERLG